MTVALEAFVRRPVETGGWIGSWSPGIGDPSVMGWVTVVLYFVAAAQCFFIGRRHDLAFAKFERGLWRLIALGLLALGINKQLDLQSALTEAGRLIAREQGWYEQRGELQRMFIIEVAVVLAILAVLLAVITRRAPAPTRVAVLGSCVLLGFVVIRASSFHHMDVLIDMSWLGIRMNWVLEIGGILVVFAGARLRLRQKQAPRPVRVRVSRPSS